MTLVKLSGELQKLTQSGELPAALKEEVLDTVFILFIQFNTYLGSWQLSFFSMKLILHVLLASNLQEGPALYCPICCLKDPVSARTPSTKSKPLKKQPASDE